jgi:hypothetical protein
MQHFAYKAGHRASNGGLSVVNENVLPCGNQGVHAGTVQEALGRFASLVFDCIRHAGFTQLRSCCTNTVYERRCAHSAFVRPQAPGLGERERVQDREGRGYVVVYVE